MKIAVASQNRKEITGHTGRRRKFWIYTIENDAIGAKDLKYVFGVLQEYDSLGNPLESHSIPMQAETVAEKSV